MGRGRVGARRAQVAARGGRKLFVVGAVVVLAVGLVSQLAGAGTTTKPYTLNINGTATAGTSSSFTLTLHNEANPQPLGSANITPPSGFTVTAATPSAVASVVANVVQLRNLNLAPDHSVTITVQASVPCASGPGVWQVTAKQSNDFNGPPGNDFSLDTAVDPSTGMPKSQLATPVVGACHPQLHFFTQPADAQKNMSITDQQFNAPPGGAVQVEVLDGNTPAARVTSSTASISVALDGNPAGVTLGGTTTLNAVAGVASFTNLTVDVHGTYRLVATSTGIDSATSSAFGIFDSVGVCSPTQSCSVSFTQLHSVTTQANGNSSTGALAASLGQDAVSCGDGFNHAPSTTTLLPSSNFSKTSGKTAVVTIDKAVVQQTPNNGVAFYQVCYSGAAFTDRGGNHVAAGGTGLLPDCKQVLNTAPCVVSITKDKAGDVVETLSLPAGDPRYR